MELWGTLEQDSLCKCKTWRRWQVKEPVDGVAEQDIGDISELGVPKLSIQEDVSSKTNLYL